MNMLYKTSLNLSVLLLVLAGCSTPLDIGELASSLLPNRETAATPLAYYEWSLAAGSEQLTQEQARLEPLAEQGTNPVVAVQLGMVNMALESRIEGPLVENLDSLHQYCISLTCENYVRLGAVLNQLVSVQRTLQLARAEQTREQQDLAALRSRLTTLQQRIMALEAQIDALTSLEQEMIQREFYELSQ